jgi:ADP-ribose pyrophosphatase YjhB (NUDIX family)
LGGAVQECAKLLATRLKIKAGVDFTPRPGLAKLSAMRPSEFFQHCPRCGRRQGERRAGPAFRCEACGFVYYFNPAIAAAAFIVRPDQATLFIRRAREPAKGKLAIPGGFIDIGEMAEAALRREVLEEVGLELHSLDYLCSHPNDYHYQDVTYPVLDLFFVGEVRDAGAVAALDGVESYCWLRPEQVDVSDIAFPSIQFALTRYVGAANA